MHDNGMAVEFQSRNRGSFDFKKTVANLSIRNVLFQSRNRGSFDFKFMVFLHAITQLALEFQSRNRGSFDFKVGILPLFLFMRDFVSIS